MGHEQWRRLAWRILWAALKDAQPLNRRRLRQRRCGALCGARRSEHEQAESKYPGGGYGVATHEAIADVAFGAGCKSAVVVAQDSQPGRGLVGGARGLPSACRQGPE